MSISFEYDKELGRIVRNVGKFILLTKSQIRRQKKNTQYLISIFVNPSAFENTVYYNALNMCYIKYIHGPTYSRPLAE